MCEVSHRMKQYPTSQKITGTVSKNQSDIQVCVFMDMSVTSRWKKWKKNQPTCQ